MIACYLRRYLLPLCLRGWLQYTGTNPYLKPGALLAVPAAAAPGVVTKTVPGAKILKALTTYGEVWRRRQSQSAMGGNVPSSHLPPLAAACCPPAGAYIVDDTACDTAAICAEPSITTELEAEYGISFDIGSPASPGAGGATADFYWDLVAIFQALQVVANNGATSVGGGGTPTGPLAPPICPM